MMVGKHPLGINDSFTQGMAPTCLILNAQNLSFDNNEVVNLVGRDQINYFTSSYDAGEF
jgi:hypothetical protein